MKYAFWFGLGLGAVAGAFLYKNCSRAKKIYDTAETNIQEKIDECKEDICKRKAQKQGQE